MIALPDVDTLMAGGLAEWLAAKSKEREDTRQLIWRINVAGFSVAAIGASMFWMIGLPFQFSILIAAIFGMVTLTASGHFRKLMVNRLKTQMNGALAAALGIDYSVACQSGEEFAIAEQYRLLPHHHDAYFQDRWSGTIASIDFLLYEAKLTEKRGSGKNRRTVTVFEGVILQFTFARDFLGTTLVRRDGLKFSLFGFGEKVGELERVRMVDPAFENAFDVYSNDPVEGRYLVHPSYCERLLELERDFCGSGLVALFHGGSLIVTIKAEAMFESATLDPEQDRALLAKTIDQFGSMARLITLLNERPR
ncbi:MAG: DUF3137 domain-containing protein [Sphingorhabdus sp.]